MGGTAEAFQSSTLDNQDNQLSQLDHSLDATSQQATQEATTHAAEHVANIKKEIETQHVIDESKEKEYDLKNEIDTHPPTDQLLQYIASTSTLKNIGLENTLTHPYKNPTELKRAIKWHLKSHYQHSRRKKWKALKDANSDFRDALKDFHEQNNLTNSSKTMRVTKRNAEFLENEHYTLEKEMALWKRIESDLSHATADKAFAEEFQHRSQWLTWAITAMKNNTIADYPAYTPSDAAVWQALNHIYYRTHQQDTYGYQPSKYPPISSNACLKKYKGVFDLIAGENATDNPEWLARKKRFGQLASLAWWVATIYAIGNVLWFWWPKKDGKTDKRRWWGILAAMGAWRALTGKWLSGIFKEVVQWWSNMNTLMKKSHELVGWPSEEFITQTATETPASGTEINTMAMGKTLSLVDWLTHNQCQQYFVKQNNQWTLATDTKGNYLISQQYKNDPKKIKQLKNLSPDILDIGIKSIIGSGGQFESSDKIIETSPFTTRITALNTYATEHWLEVATNTTAQKNILADFYAGKISLQSLIKQDILTPTDTPSVTDTIPAYHTDLDRQALASFDDVTNILGNLTLQELDDASTSDTVSLKTLSNNHPKLSDAITQLTSTQKQAAIMTISMILQSADADDMTTTLKEYITTLKPLYEQRLALQDYANAHSLLIQDERAYENFPMTATNGKTLQQTQQEFIDQAMKDGSIVFNIDSNPLLDDVNTSQLQAQIKQWEASPLSLEKKAEIAAWTQHLKISLADKLPTNISVTPNQDWSSCDITSYYKSTRIDTEPNKSGIYTITHGKDTYSYAKSLPEALYMANLLNTAPWMMQWLANNVTPFQSDSGRIDFKHNNNRWEASKHIWTSWFDKDVITQAIDTTYLSKDAIATYLPSLSIDNNRTQFCQQLNTMDIRERERDINTLRNNLSTTLQKIDSLNANRTHQVGLYDKKWNKITETHLNKKTYQEMSGTGNLVELRWESPSDNQSDKSSITIDLHDNQLFGNLSPLMWPDLATTIGTADTFLTAEYILRTWWSDLSTLVVDDIPEWIREDLGLEAVIQTWEAARKYLQPFFAGIENIIDTAFLGSVYTVDLIGDGAELGVWIIKLIASWFGLWNVPQV